MYSTGHVNTVVAVHIKDTFDFVQTTSSWYAVMFLLIAIIIFLYHISAQKQTFIQ